MGTGNVLGPKKEIREVLERLGIKEGTPPVTPVSPIEQPFIEVPEAGEVTFHRLLIDDLVREAAEGVIDLKGKENRKFVSDINWYQAMALAQKLDLELLTNKEYWQCVRYTLENKEEHPYNLFADNLKDTTWTQTLVVWYHSEEIKSLMKFHNHSGHYPIAIEGADVVPDMGWSGGYRIEGGKLISPTRFFANKRVTFDYADMEELTGIPGTNESTGPFNYSFHSPSSSIPIACGFTKQINSYTIFANWSTLANYETGCFLKKKNEQE